MIKRIYYLMMNPYSDIGVTLNTYTHLFRIGGCCRRDETNAENGRNLQRNVWRRKRKADETEHVQGGVAN